MVSATPSLKRKWDPSGHDLTQKQSAKLYSPHNKQMGCITFPPSLLILKPLHPCCPSCQSILLLSILLSTHRLSTRLLSTRLLSIHLLSTLFLSILPCMCRGRVRATIAGIGRCCSNPTARSIICYCYCLENIYCIAIALTPPTASEPMNKLSKPSSFRKRSCESNHLCHEALPLSRPSALNHSPNAGCSARSFSGTVPSQIPSAD